MPDLAENLAALHARIAAAAARAGRAADDVELVAVSKTHPPEAVHAACRQQVMLAGELRRELRPAMR